MMHSASPSTPELLGALIGKRAAKRILASPRGLAGIRSATVAELVASYGLTETAAKRTRAAVELAMRIDGERLRRGSAIRSSADLFRTNRTMRDLDREQFRALFLDGKHRVMSEMLVSQGTLTSSPVHPREVFGRAIREGAAAVVFVHNHPSGDPSPSSDDLDITRRLAEVGELVGIKVLDHVIVGDGTYTSLADRGLLR